MAGTIEKIDARSKAVVVDGQAYEGDALVVALGADYNLKAIPGLQEGGHNLYSLEGAGSLRNALSSFDPERSRSLPRRRPTSVPRRRTRRPC